MTPGAADTQRGAGLSMPHVPARHTSVHGAGAGGDLSLTAPSACFSPSAWRQQVFFAHHGLFPAALPPAYLCAPEDWLCPAGGTCPVRGVASAQRRVLRFLKGGARGRGRATVFSPPRFLQLMQTSLMLPASSLPQASESPSLLAFIFQSWTMGPKALLCRLPAVCSWTCNLTTLGLSFSSVKQGFVMECLYHWVVGGTCSCLAHGKWWIMLAFY